jgi:hypothetical protein
MVTIGVISSIEPIMTAQTQRKPEKRTIFFSLPKRNLKQGRLWSSTIAYSNLGAEAKD